MEELIGMLLSRAREKDYNLLVSAEINGGVNISALNKHTGELSALYGVDKNMRNLEISHIDNISEINMWLFKQINECIRTLQCNDIKRSVGSIDKIRNMDKSIVYTLDILYVLHIDEHDGLYDITLELKRSKYGETGTVEVLYTGKTECEVLGFLNYNKLPNTIVEPNETCSEFIKKVSKITNSVFEETKFDLTGRLEKIKRGVNEKKNRFG